jgi:hypothetical protein
MHARFVTAIAAAAVLAVTSSCGHQSDSPTSPSGNPTGALTGHWSGTSDYINAPFLIDLQQSGTSVTGRYIDQKDSATVNGTVSGSSITMDVSFGDTGMRMTGTVLSTSRILGSIVVPVLGNRTFSFEMTRVS